jgi:hypothetical protein
MWDPLGSEGAFSKATTAQPKSLSSISQQLAKATFLKAKATTAFHKATIQPNTPLVSTLFSSPTVHHHT